VQVEHVPAVIVNEYQAAVRSFDVFVGHFNELLGFTLTLGTRDVLNHVNRLP
jgi:hypothetical protein